MAADCGLLQALGLDITADVRFGSLADIRKRIRHVRFTPKSGPSSEVCDRSPTATTQHRDS